MCYVLAKERNFGQTLRKSKSPILLVSAEANPRYFEHLLLRILRSMPPLILHDGREAPRFTVSVGIAAASPNETWQGLLHRADMALYDAKANGRDRMEKAQPPG